MIENTYRGMRVITDPGMVDWVEDWSGVRSPARARRRRKKHPQRIRPVAVPKREILMFGDFMTCHPDIWRKLKQRAEEIQRLAAIGQLRFP